MNAAHYDWHELRELVEGAGLSHEALAALLGVSRLTITRALNGKNASYELLCSIAAEVGRDVRPLLRPVTLVPASKKI